MSYDVLLIKQIILSMPNKLFQEKGDALLSFTKKKHVVNLQVQCDHVGKM